MFDRLRNRRIVAGIVSLIATCVFTVGWIRSFTYYDDLTPRHMNDIRNSLISFHGSLNWQRVKSPIVALRQTKVFRWATMSASVPNVIINLTKWKWEFCGIGVREYSTADTNVTVLVVPYLMVVVPMTLLSTWLLLIGGKTNPRSSIWRGNISPIDKALLNEHN